MADPSIREIAQALVERTTPDDAGATREQVRADEEDERHSQAGATDDETGDDDRPDDEGDDSRELAPDADDDGDDDGDDDSPVYRVKVDGEARDVTLSELIASYTGEGAIAKRLQEATAARDDAARARDVAVEQERAAARDVIQRDTEALRQQASQLAQVYQTYADAILRPEVAMPHPSMSQTDPIGYLTAVEAYRQDQDRLRQQAAHMHEVVQAASRLEQEHRAEFARQQVQQMIVEVPAMANPEYRKAQAKRVLEVGKAIGFSEEEIRSNATDRRVIYGLMLAAQGAEVMMQTRNKGKATVKPKAPPPKPTASVVRERNGRFTGNKAAFAKARETGKVEDVARTLIVRRPQGRA